MTGKSWRPFARLAAAVTMTCVVTLPAAAAPRVEPPGPAPVAGGVAAGAAALASGQSAPQAQMDRETAQTMFYDELLPLVNTPVGWTGSVAGCVAGSPSDTALNANLAAVNLFRKMQQLPPVTLNAAYNRGAQAAALIMHAQGALSHGPTPAWACFTPEGAVGAGRSNLYLGVTGASAIWGYMTDPGASNTAVGHRRWIIHPGATSMGVGMTDHSHALWVIGDSWSSASEPQWLAWPTAGHFPAWLEPEGRWSLGTSDNATSFRQARVRVDGPQGPMKVTAHEPVEGYAMNTLVWQVDGLPQAGAMEKDSRYRVTVEGVTRAGATLAPIVYDVALVAARPATAPTTPRLTGTPRPGVTLRLADLTWPADLSYDVQWLRNGRPIVGASGLSYTPAAGDVGTRISARVTLKREYYQQSSVTTAPLTVLAPPGPRRWTTTKSPALFGDARVGSTVRVSPGSWTPAPATVSFQWYRGNTPIKRANKSTYQLSRADRGASVRAVVTVTRPGWPKGTTSTKTARVR